MNTRDVHQLLTIVGVTQPWHVAPNKLSNSKLNQKSPPSRQTCKSDTKDRQDWPIQTQ